MRYVSMMSVILVGVLVAAGGVSYGDTVSFRQGGGGSFTDATFDHTDIDNTTNEVGHATTFYTLGSIPNFVLIGMNELPSLLPLASGSQITSATLTIVKYWGDNDTVACARMKTNWLRNPAGSNQGNVTGMRADLAAGIPWASGAFSSSDIDNANKVSNTWGTTYAEPMDLDVTDMIKTMYDDRQFYGFACYAASGTEVAIYSNNNGTESKRPILKINYTPGSPPPTYALTVNSGSGDGSYYAGVVTTISADTPPPATVFSQWVGDTSAVGNVNVADTSVCMPTAAVTVTATYVTAPTYVLTVNSGTGGGSYIEDAVVSISASAGPSGSLFQQWSGDVSYLDNPDSPTTDVTMPAVAVTVTATYAPGTGYALTVNSGSASGMYLAGVDAPLSANPAPSGLKFNMWVGDMDAMDAIADRMAANTYFTMPAEEAEVTATYTYPNIPIDYWPAFQLFCQQRFGAEKEPLAYEIFGSTLEFMAGGDWTHVSETSACIGFETKLPAKTYIEYGQTVAYGSQADVNTDLHRYIHVGYLKNLLPDTTYHYRLVATDERANTIYSGDRTLTTATPANVIYVPAGVSGPPYNLTQSGKTYLVTQDIVADGTGFEIKADNVTLDLGGHKLIYNNTVQSDPTGPRGDFWDYMEYACMGVRVYNRANYKIVNGYIKQGPGNNSAKVHGVGYSPIYNYSSDGEIAGVSVEYAGEQVSGIDTKWAGPDNIHHNVVLDLSGAIFNRQMMISGIDGAKYSHHNLLKRVRHSGLGSSAGVDVYNNEVYVDSCDTNSFAVNFYDATNAEAYGNRLFGTGYLVVGVATVSGAADVNVHDNFIHLEEMEPDTRSGEYGAQSGGYCCRITWGGDNIKYYDNVMATYAQDGGMVRGTWFYTQSSTTDVFFYDNILKAVLRNTGSDTQGAIVVAGDGNLTAPPHVYENNRVISNFCNVRFGESYGTGSNTRLYDNTFVREGPVRGDYRTIQCGSENPMTKNHEFYDSSFESGAGYDEVLFGGAQAANNDFYVGWTLSVETEPLADITIKDLSTATVWTGQADGSGDASTRLLAYRQMQAGKTWYTPHSVKAEKGAANDTVSVTMDAKKTIQIPLIQTYTLTVNNGSGSGDYEEAEVVTITAGGAPAGQEFDQWTGDTATVANVYSAGTTLTMPAASAEVTATYTDILYTLTVNSGTGDGDYAAGTVVPIEASTPPADAEFDQWIGDVSGVADTASASTTLTMPSAAAEITATYRLPGDLNGDGWVGQPDLDIVLDQWGKSGGDITDSRADPDNSGWVGQPDLDIVLDDWGKAL